MILKQLIFHLALFTLIPEIIPFSRFCYLNPFCNPKSERWPKTCHNGEHQSPININVKKRHLFKHNPQVFTLRHLSSPNFLLKNNGRTLELELNGSQRSARFFPGHGIFYSIYKLSDIHFHWGHSDSSGSEHLVNGKGYSMEMHLVHFKAKYGTKLAAVNSGDLNALAVVGVFLQVKNSSSSNPSLGEIVRNIPKVQDASEEWVKVEKSIDLTGLVPFGGVIYNYKGSLTTPPCAEDVNWYVFEKPMFISKSDVQAFRTLKDENGQFISDNHRPLQQREERNINVIKIIRKWK